MAHRLDADHPDKDGLQLRKIAKVLKAFDEEAKKRYGAACKVGVFLDYVSMPQRSRGSPEDDRTPEELATFKRSLTVRSPPPCRPPSCPPLASHPALPAPCQGINLWYGNPKTYVLLVGTDLPAGAHTNMQPYALRLSQRLRRRVVGHRRDPGYGTSRGRGAGVARARGGTGPAPEDELSA